MTRYRSNHPADAVHTEPRVGWSPVIRGAAVAAFLMITFALVGVLARMWGHIV